LKDISLLLAFSAGLLSFLSPCVLPLVPAYITFLTGSTIQEIKSQKSKLTVINKAIGFTLGFSIIFMLMGISISSLGRLFTANQYLFRKIGGIIIIIFGLHITGLIKIKWLYYERRIKSIDKITGNLSSILMGMAFATGWTPCIGPILASILIYVGNMTTLNKGFTLLTAYSLGLAIPFILAAIIIDSFSVGIKKLYRFFPLISVVSGILVITMGILTFTNSVTILNRILLQYINLPTI
jgi:Cytochrome c biogenesis protein